MLALRRGHRYCFALAAAITAACSDPNEPPSPTKLAFTVQPPASVAAGAPILPALSVAIQDADGNTVVNASNDVTISIGTNPADATLSGTRTRRAVAGIATFSDLVMDKAGAGYTLSATATNLTSAVSTPLEVRAGEASRLAFLTQPGTPVAGTTLPPISVAVQDLGGNTVMAANNLVTVSLASNTSGATITGGTVSTLAVDGIATFSGLSIAKAGSGYRLLASSDVLTSALSATFAVVPGQANKLVFTTQPGAAAPGTVLNPLAVDVQDAVGNRVTTASHTVTISLGANPSGAALSGTTTAPAVSGRVQFDELSIDKPGADYTLVAGASDLAAGTSATFSVRNALLMAVASAGYFHSCGIDGGGAAYCWGDNFFGQLGSPAVAGQSQIAAAVAGGLSFANITAGRDHACGLTAAGVVYCWGSNLQGQLGSSGGNSSVPLPVAGGLVFAQISAGYEHTCGVTTSGAGYCWGSGGNGELGNGTSARTFAPTPVSGGFVFASIGVGRFGTCGVTTAGVAYCWGRGFLGNGTTNASSQPSAVSGQLTFAAVSAGGFHSCGLTTAGAAYCWGENAFGQLGNGGTTNSAVPVAVSGGRVFVTLSVGNRHNCGITASGDGYCWGDNSNFNLGIGTPQPTSTIPALVAGGHTFARISAGRFHTCAVTTDEKAYCWGEGLLGAGAIISSGVPVRVP